MSEMPSSGPGPQPGGKSRMIGAVVLAGAVAAASLLLLRQKGPEAPPAVAEKPATPATPAAPPKPLEPPKPPRYSETIGDLEVTTTLGPIRLVGVKTENASLPKAEIETLLKGDLKGVAALDADAITAERIEFSSVIGTGEASARSSNAYHGVSARAIKAGVIGTFAAAKVSAKAEATDKRKASETAFEALTLEAVNLPLGVAWFNGADPEGKAEFGQLHGPYRIKSGQIIVDQAKVEMDEITLSHTRVRPARRPVSTIIAEMQAAAAKTAAAKTADSKSPGAEGKAPEATPPAKAEVDEAATLASVIDLLASFELGEGAVNNIRIAALTPQPEGPGAGSIKRVTFAGGGQPRIGMEGLEITGPDGRFTLASTAMGGDTLSLIVMTAEKTLRARANEPKPGDEALRAAIRNRVNSKPLPDVTFSMEGMAGDFPAEKKAPEKGRVAFSLQKAGFLLGNFVAFTPTKLDYVITGFDMPLPKESKEAGIIALREMGVEQLNLSARLAAAWQSSNERFSLQDLSVDMAKLAKLSISSEMSHVPRAFFEDPKTNWPSAMGATIENLLIDIENRGGLAKLFDIAAREQRKTGEQMRNELSALAPLLIGGMLSNHPDGSKLAQGVSAFIKTLNGLKLKVTASGPNGIGIMDLQAASQNPVEFAQKLRFEVENR